MTSTALAVPTLDQLAIPGIELSYTSLIVTDPDIGLDALVGVAEAAGRVKSATSFWVGDLCNFGEKLFGDRYVEIGEATGLSYETLTNYASVCRKVARSRRRERLAFGHHAEVASLEPTRQDEWLDAAVDNGWSRAELRDRLRSSKDRPERPEQPQWSKNEPVSLEPLSPQKIEEAEELAHRTLEKPLPPEHPLWETQAKLHARDVLALAAQVTLPRAAVENLLSNAMLVVPPDDRDEQGNGFVALALREPIYGVPRDALEEVAALAGIEIGDLGKKVE